MKKCPFCAEEIQEDAIKCKHCGEMLNKEKKGKWYFGTPFFILLLLCVGPFALPLFWFNPRYTVKRKVIVSVIIIVLTYLFTMMLVKSLDYLGNSLQMLQ